MAKKNIQMTKSQASKGAKSIVEMTRTLTQTIKLFEGLWNKKVEGTDKLTVKEYMEALGVIREGQKLQVRDIKRAWNALTDEDGCMYIWKSVPIFVHAANVSAASEEEAALGKKYRVYKKVTEDDKVDYVPVHRYEKVVIGENEWSAKLLLKGLMQAKWYDLEVAKAKRVADKFNELETIYAIVDGEEGQYAVQVSKTDVE